MKNIMLRHNRKILLAFAVLFSALLLGGTSQALARDGGEGRQGYWDRNGQYHNYVYYNHHRGYWNQHANGIRFWINVD